ncbi:Gfo/Idh/MocA family protein [Marinithermus hydrothermalis]|uniref:Inositol 2-dehydrogenase n=1 Tax=Marinithermus hydrothermalis (strain DSM 14884 / JCM 11576 / T1) TaxID=869210 RepID=F2NQG6_MARHT|nr:Gfo/Idh/MocA family oxidoreductase [Marinithermus hydrothermalis]AEB11693.1 Inositol 2-dehydrogenase [Marinithermus hydrothermalis DSM 14884]
MQAKLPLALIGAGRMGTVHARVLAGLADCRVLKVVDPRETRAARLAERLGARATPHLEDVLEDPEIAAALLTTPTPTHAEVVEALAMAGKAVFVEKPLAQSLEAGRRLVAAVERTGVPAQVGFQRRYDPAYRKAKALLESGRLGRVLSFRGVGRDAGPPALEFLKDSGGVLVDMGIHDLDVARWLVGEVQEVRAFGGHAVPELAAHGLADTAVAIFRFENGAVGTLETSWYNAYGYEIRTEVVGEKGRVHIETDRYPDLNVYDPNGGHFPRPSGFEERFRDAYAAELAAFVQGVRAEQPLSPTPRDSWYTLRLALAAQHSLETGRTVTVPAFGGAL